MVPAGRGQSLPWRNARIRLKIRTVLWFKFLICKKGDPSGSPFIFDYYG